jgi:hypothetical protein
MRRNFRESPTSSFGQHVSSYSAMVTSGMADVGARGNRNLLADQIRPTGPPRSLRT